MYWCECLCASVQSVVYVWVVLLKIWFTQAVAPMWRFVLYKSFLKNSMC